MPDSPTMLSLHDVAKLLNVTPKTLYGLRYRNDAPPAIRVGRELRFRPADVERWIAERLAADQERAS